VKINNPDTFCEWVVEGRIAKPNIMANDNNDIYNVMGALVSLLNFNAEEFAAICGYCRVINLVSKTIN
jgi:hypothetical protein